MYVIPAIKQGSLETAFIIPSVVLIPDNLQSWIEQEAGMDAKTLKTWMSDFMPTAWQQSVEIQTIQEDEVSIVLGEQFEAKLDIVVGAYGGLPLTYRLSRKRRYINLRMGRLLDSCESQSSKCVRIWSWQGLRRVLLEPRRGYNNN